MNYEPKILGILLMGIGIFLCYKSAELYYLYNFTDINFFYMLPIYELCARFILGLFLIPTGRLIFLERKKGFDRLYKIAWGIIFYSALMFSGSAIRWIEEFGFIYLLTGLLFILIDRRDRRSRREIY